MGYVLIFGRWLVCVCW